MENNLVTKWKWFWAWEDEKEEEWLRRMAQAGIHLYKANYFGQYSFLAGEPKDVVYRLDFVTSKGKDGSYFQLFQDAGWEHVGEMGSWQYWRKPVQAGQKAPEIFTDNESKINKYRRVLAFMIIFLPMLTFNSLNLLRRADTPWMGPIILLNSLVLIALAYCVVRVALRIKSLQRK